MRFWLLALLGALVACGGGSADAPVLQEAPEPTDDPAPTPAAQQPPVDAEVFGVPGKPVEGLAATYVTTQLGWIAPDGSVVFEAVIKWLDNPNVLACGIFRRAPDGRVNIVLLQDQPIPGPEPGRIIHPRLPLESGDDTILVPADIVEGAHEHGLFAVPKAGGAPVLLAGDDEGRFVGAQTTANGSVLAQIDRPSGRRIVLIESGQPPRVLCDRCLPGLSSDGRCAVVRHDDAAWMIEFDGTEQRIGGIGDPAPHGSGTIVGVRGAWINDAGAFVLHLDSDSEEHPDILVRVPGMGKPSEVIAACGEDAPGIAGHIAQIHVAEGRSSDVVFAARLSGNPTAGAALFCARPGEAAVPLVANGDRIGPSKIALLEKHVVADGNGEIAFAARIYGDDGLPAAEGVFRVAPGNVPQRVLSTDAPVPAAGGAVVRTFLYPLRYAIDVDAQGRTLVHAGLVEARRPEATLGALFLVR